MRVTAGGPPISVSVVIVDPTAAVSSVDPAVAVTRVVPALQLAYIEIVTTARMDDSGLYQYKADMAVVVDSTAIAFSRPITSELGFSDDNAYALAKVLTDSVGTSDVCIPMLIFLRDFAETVTSTDAKVLSHAKLRTDSYTLADTPPIRAVNKNVSDAFAMNDMADIGDGIAFQFDDYVNNVVTTADGTVIVVAPGYLDPITLTDSTAFDVSRIASDSFSQADLLAISFAGTYTDSATLVDNRAIGFSRPVTDSFGQSDNATLASGLSKTDSISFTEAGSMLVQNYVELGYFAEDYVGTTYTF